MRGTEEAGFKSASSAPSFTGSNMLQSRPGPQESCLINPSNSQDGCAPSCLVQFPSRDDEEFGK